MRTGRAAGATAGRVGCRAFNAACRAASARRARPRPGRCGGATRGSGPVPSRRSRDRSRRAATVAFSNTVSWDGRRRSSRSRGASHRPMDAVLSWGLDTAFRTVSRAGVNGTLPEGAGSGNVAHARRTPCRYGPDSRAERPDSGARDARHRTGRNRASPTRSSPSALFWQRGQELALFSVLARRLSSSSMPSFVPTAESIRRIVQTILRTGSSRSSSSRRVPERWTSIAGKMRFSASLRSRISSLLPVPLNSS